MAANPYLEARRKWDERYGDLVLGKRNGQIAAGGLLAMSLILASGMVWLATRSRYIPYVVEVNELGYALTVPQPLTPTSVAAARSSLLTTSKSPAPPGLRATWAIIHSTPVRILHLSVWLTELCGGSLLIKSAAVRSKFGRSIQRSSLGRGYAFDGRGMDRSCCSERRYIIADRQ